MTFFQFKSRLRLYLLLLSEMLEEMKIWLAFTRDNNFSLTIYSKLKKKTLMTFSLLFYCLK